MKKKIKGFQLCFEQSSLMQFSKEQEDAVNEMAKKARTMLELKPHWDMEAWFDKMKKINPYLKGVSIREFGAAVLGKPFEN